MRGPTLRGRLGSWATGTPSGEDGREPRVETKAVDGREWTPRRSCGNLPPRGALATSVRVSSRERQGARRRKGRRERACTHGRSARRVHVVPGGNVREDSIWGDLMMQGEQLRQQAAG